MCGERSGIVICIRLSIVYRPDFIIEHPALFVNVVETLVKFNWPNQMTMALLYFIVGCWVQNHRREIDGAQQIPKNTSECILR